MVANHTQLGWPDAPSAAPPATVAAPSGTAIASSSKLQPNGQPERRRRAGPAVPPPQPGAAGPSGQGASASGAAPSLLPSLSPPIVLVSPPAPRVKQEAAKTAVAQALPGDNVSMVVDLSLDSDEDDGQNEAGSLTAAAGASRLVGLQANARAGSGRTRSRAAQLSATPHPRTVVPTVESQETGTSGEVLLIDSDHEMAGCSSRPLRDLTLPWLAHGVLSSLRPSSAAGSGLAAVQAIPAVPPSPTTELNRLKRQLARRDRQIGALEKDRNAKGEEAEAASRAAAEATRAAKEVAAAAAAALAAAQGAAPAGSSSMLLVVPPPPNWDPARPGEEAGTMFVRLPWPGGCDWG